MQALRAKHTIVALNVLAVGKYGNDMPESTNSTKSRHFQDIIRAHYRNSIIIFCHVTSSYSF